MKSSRSSKVSITNPLTFPGIQNLEDDYAEQMKHLQGIFEQEKAAKQQLEEELKKAKEDLETIELRYPAEVGELRAQIEQTKRDTIACDQRTKQLSSELNAMKQK